MFSAFVDLIWLLISNYCFSLFNYTNITSMRSHSLQLHALSRRTRINLYSLAAKSILFSRFCFASCGRLHVSAVCVLLRVIIFEWIASATKIKMHKHNMLPVAIDWRAHILRRSRCAFSSVFVRKRARFAVNLFLCFRLTWLFRSMQS